jgi:hypothetical protein
VACGDENSCRDSNCEISERESLGGRVSLEKIVVLLPLKSLYTAVVLLASFG